MIFDHGGREVSRGQCEHRQLLPRPGWVEHDPMEILENSLTVMAQALAQAGLQATDLAAVGISNQRETTVIWDRRYRAPVPERSRLAGHPDRSHRRSTSERPGGRAGTGHDGAAGRHLFLRP